MEIEIEIARTRAKRERRCRFCGGVIPAGGQALTHTVRTRGIIGAGTKYSRKVARHTCLACAERHKQKEE